MSLTIQPFVDCFIAVVNPLLRNTVSISGAASPVPSVAVEEEVEEADALLGADPCCVEVLLAAACSHSFIYIVAL